MVFMGKRGAEKGHDPVTHDAVHRALITVDGLNHPFQYGIEERLRFLSVPAG